MICKHCYYKPEITKLESDRTDFLDSKACASFIIPYCFQDIYKSYGSQNLKNEFVCNQLNFCLFLEENIYTKSS